MTVSKQSTHGYNQGGTEPVKSITYKRNLLLRYNMNITCYGMGMGLSTRLGLDYLVQVEFYW